MKIEVEKIEPVQPDIRLTLELTMREAEALCSMMGGSSGLSGGPADISMSIFMALQRAEVPCNVNRYLKRGAQFHPEWPK